MLVGFVGIPTGGIALPDLDQLIGDRAAIPAEQPPADVDALPQGLALMPDREVGVVGVHVIEAEDRPGYRLPLGRQRYQRPPGGPLHRRAIVGNPVRRIDHPASGSQGRTS